MPQGMRRPAAWQRRASSTFVARATVLARLGAAGADRVGFTNMTALAYEPSGFNAARGRVRNPWNPDFVAGGSSSGSAAAVASGSVVAALGSDTGGSLRIPAHACGVSAWKPTWGLVSIAGAMALAPTLDAIGLLARSVAVLRGVAGHLAELPEAEAITRVAVHFRCDRRMRAGRPPRSGRWRGGAGGVPGDARPR